MVQIQNSDWHKELSVKYLDFLLSFRQKYPGFTFWLPEKIDATINNWFQGTDFLFLTPYKKGDGLNTSGSIGFLSVSEKNAVTDRLEITIDSKKEFSRDKLVFYNDLKKVLKLQPNKEVNSSWIKVYDPKDSIKNLEDFLLNDKPIIDRLISQYGLEREYRITEDEFNYSLHNVLLFRENVGEDDLTQGAGLDIDLKSNQRKDARPKERVDKKIEPKDGADKQNFNFQSRFHADTGFEDQLDHKLYATAIAKIIKDDKTKPPVNIAIIAPWGHGKTTLMQFIREQFEKKEDWESRKAKGFYITARNLLRKLQGFAKDLENNTDPIRNVIKTKPKEYPTIWFNPWKYQSSEQIWAGLGHAIITQLVSKYTPMERELIWLRLKAKRVDSNFVRSEIHKRVLNSIWPFLIFGVTPAVMIFIIRAFGIGENYDGWLVGGGSVGIVSTIIGLVYKNIQTLDSVVEGKVADFVREPDYSGKLGLYHEISEDLNIVCQELIDPQKPAIIFIDDLDRCSPKTVAEVFESINLMITGDLKDRCYFVLGMDAQIVAAALDTQYTDWAGRLPNHEKNFGSVGWYFLDKFIQLPFFIPVLNPVSKRNYLNNLFGYSTDYQFPQKPEAMLSEDEIRQEAKKILETIDQKDFVPSTENAGSKKTQQIKEEVVKQSIENSSDSPEIKELINQFADYLDSSPRGMKRFANLLRFYDSQKNVRKAFASSGERSEISDSKTLAKWLIINIRWPQMVRWLQWEREEVLVFTNDPEIKAKEIDMLVKNIKRGNDSYKNWVILLQSRGIEKDCNLKWLYDKDLFQLLHDHNDNNSSLEMALKCDVW